MNQSGSLRCSFASICSGCDLAFENGADLKIRRLSLLRLLGLEVDNLLSNQLLSWQWISGSGLRDRVDFVFERKGSQFIFGLYGRQSVGHNQPRRLIDLPGCSQLSPSLEAWLHEFRSQPPPIVTKGSVRLRVAPDGKKGAWLDLANAEIRDLLNEQKWLKHQVDQGHIIELGQKRKAVQWLNSGPAPDFSSRIQYPWIQSQVLDRKTQQLRPAPIFSTVGSFSQPGSRANEALTQALHTQLSALDSDAQKSLRCIELGSGSGNLTAALLSRGHSVHAIEFDRIALEGLDLTLADLYKTDPELEDRVTVQQDDALQRQITVSEDGFDLIVVDPPRSGLKQFFDSIAKLVQTTHPLVVYVSCHPTSFAQDAQRLTEMGYHLKRLAIVEQFPFTSHFELVATFAH